MTMIRMGDNTGISDLLGHHAIEALAGIISNQIFHYTHCITPKRVTSLQSPIFASLHPGDTSPCKEMLQRWQALTTLYPI